MMQTLFPSTCQTNMLEWVVAQQNLIYEYPRVNYKNINFNVFKSSAKLNFLL